MSDVTKKQLLQGEVRQKAASLLGIGLKGPWDVTDKNGDLIILNTQDWKQTFGPESMLRGLVIDRTGQVVAPSYYPERPSLCSDFIKRHYDCYELFGDQKISLDCKLYQAMDGIIMRVFRYAGRNYITTLRSLDTTTSRIRPDADSYLDYYYQSSCPDPETLFDPESEYSPWVYTFLVSHRQLINSSRFNPRKKGVSIFLGAAKTFNVDTSLYPDSIIDWKQAELKLAKSRPEAIAKDLPYLQTNLKAEEATHFLKYGYGSTNVGRFEHRDGESIVAIFTDGTIQRISSRAYKYRLGLVKNSLNLLHQFFSLASDARLLDNSKFNAKYPIPSKYLRRKYDLKLQTDHRTTTKLTESQRLHIIWMNYYIAVPEFYRPQTRDYVNEYIKAIDTIIRKVGTIWINKRYDPEVHSARLKQVLDAVTKVAILNQRKGVITERDIRQVIEKKPGSFLYRLYKDLV